MLNYNHLRKLGRRPRLHPNGFIQLDLNAQRTMRLHVWPDEPVPAQKTRHPIHDHIFAMSSTVITGQLVNKVYDFVVGDKDRVEYVLHQAQHIGHEETILAPLSRRGYLDQAHTDIVPADHSYTLGAWLLHDSIPVGLTATIMQKHDLGLARSVPHIAVPVGIQPDNDYRRETIDEELLWRFIQRAVRG